MYWGCQTYFCEWKSISPNWKHLFTQWKFNVGQRHINFTDFSLLSYVFDPNSRMLHLGGMWFFQHRSEKLTSCPDTLAQRWLNAGPQPGECFGCGGSVPVLGEFWMWEGDAGAFIPVKPSLWITWICIHASITGSLPVLVSSADTLGEHEWFQNFEKEGGPF